MKLVTLFSATLEIENAFPKCKYISHICVIDASFGKPKPKDEAKFS